MTTLAQLVTDTRNILYGLERVERPAEDTLNGSITAGATSLTPTTTTMWFRNDYAEFSDGELFIFAADSAGATAVRGAQLGSTAANHANGAVMWKNPLFPRVEIEKRVRNVIRSQLWPHVWTWHRDSITASRVDFMYDLDQYIDGVVEVYQENIDASEKFYPLPNGWWDVEREKNTVVATQGGMLRLRKVYDYDEPVYFTAKRRPHVDDLANLADPIADMIPIAAAALALNNRFPQGMNDSARSRRDKAGFREAYEGLMGEFIRQRDAYNRILWADVQPQPRYRKKFKRVW